MTHEDRSPRNQRRWTHPFPRRGVALMACAALAVTCVLAACGGGDNAAGDLAEAGLSTKELLGKRLFEDTTLSEPAGQSWAMSQKLLN